MSKPIEKRAFLNTKGLGAVVSHVDTDDWDGEKYVDVTISSGYDTVSISGVKPLEKLVKVIQAAIDAAKGEAA